jgi:predicted DNA-binding transcriptional regulator YafY
MSASATGAELSARLAKIDTAIARRKRIEFEYFTMQSGEVAPRRVDPYLLLFQGTEFYLVGHSHERNDVRVFRLSRIRGKVAYATKAEHDFQRPASFDPREYANRIPWQLGDTRGTADIWVSDDIAWHVERNFGRYGEMVEADDTGRVFRTDYAIPRLVIAWALGYGNHAHIAGPPDLAAEARARLDAIIERHTGEPFADLADGRPPDSDGAETEEPPTRSRQEAAIRPERFARLVTLASVLIAAGREGRRPPVREVCERLKISEQELREDISVLNVVNFGGGAYVLYAEVQGNEVEIDTEPYSDTFDRPARLLPIEANALIAAIEFLGEHLSEHLRTARQKIEAALGEIGRDGLLVGGTGADDSAIARDVSGAIGSRNLIELEYWQPNEDKFSTRVVEPYALMNGLEGWYIASFDRTRDDTRSFRLDRVKRVTVLTETYEPRASVDEIAVVEGWPSTGQVEGSRVAQVWISPEQARWAREERTVLAELPDGAVIIEWTYKGEDYLVKEVLKEAGDAAVLEPADAREAVLHAAERLVAPAR